MRHRGGAESVLHVLDAEEQARAGGPVEIRGGDGVEGAEKDGDGAQDAHGGDALGDAEVGELSVREGHEKPAEESLLADARAEGEREDARKAEGREGGEDACFEDVAHLPEELVLIRLGDGEGEARE